MAGAPARRQLDDDQIRAQFEELDTEGGSVVRITDPENAEAWIASDHAVSIED